MYICYYFIWEIVYVFFSNVYLLCFIYRWQDSSHPASREWCVGCVLPPLDPLPPPPPLAGLLRGPSPFVITLLPSSPQSNKIAHFRNLIFATSFPLPIRPFPLVRCSQDPPPPHLFLVRVSTAIIPVSTQSFHFHRHYFITATFIPHSIHSISTHFTSIHGINLLLENCEAVDSSDFSKLCYKGDNIHVHLVQ